MRLLTIFNISISAGDLFSVFFFFWRKRILQTTSQIYENPIMKVLFSCLNCACTGVPFTFVFIFIAIFRRTAAYLLRGLFTNLHVNFPGGSWLTIWLYSAADVGFGE